MGSPPKQPMTETIYKNVHKIIRYWKICSFFVQLCQKKLEKIARFQQG